MWLGALAARNPRYARRQAAPTRAILSRAYGDDHMFCSRCGTEAMPDASFCAKCGSPLAIERGPRAFASSRSRHTNVSQFLNSEASTNTNDGQGDGGWFFARLFQGDYGLPKTFWLFGILVWIVHFAIDAALLSATRSSANHTIGVIVDALFLVYLLIVIPGTWNAANKYEGLKLFSILAKLICVVWLILLAGLAFLIVLGLKGGML